MAKQINKKEETAQAPQNPCPDVFTTDEWDDFCKEDPSLKLMATTTWQSTTVNIGEDLMAESLPTDTETRGNHPYREDIQKKSWNAYREEGPINAYVHSTADMVAGKGFGCYSDDKEIDLYLKDLFYSYRNQLYTRVYSWMIRMIAEGELFLLLAFDDEGNATVRTLEPGRISETDGMILDPDDASTTLFYRYTGAGGTEELIPGIAIAFNPDLQKTVKDKLSADLLKKSKGKRAFKPVGGYRRFVIHWKNLTGIHEYLRDIPYMSATLEYFYLYKNALKWGLDYKKAQSSYAVLFKFDESPTGRMAWHLWQRMTPAQKEATGLTKPITPGTRLFMMPGITCEIKAPQFSKLSGENQDLLNMAGAGARSPQDLWQGQSSGSTHASLRASRSPLEIFVSNLQDKFSNFFQYELLRACFHVKSSVSQFPETFKKSVTYEAKGKLVTEDIDVEPCELVTVTAPRISLEQDPEKQTSALLGNKHSGLSGLGMSDTAIAERLGVNDLSRQRREKGVQRDIYGDPEEVVE